MSGKLTVYCPYYGNTGIGQINLAATGSGELVLQSTSTEPMTILEKPANNATASITFRLEGEDAPPSSGLPVIIDNNYTLTDVQNVLTNDGTKDVETGNGFSASLDYAGTEGWITLGDCNYDAATKKFTQHFTLGDNASTESPRTGAVVVFSPSRREVARFIIKQEPATPPTIIDATNLAVGQSANCYIISKPGRYELPAYKGVHKDLTTAPYCTGKPDEIWNDSGNTIRFLQANFSDNKIIFDVESVEAGNAIIGIRNPKNENDILWSWHLWFCPNGTPGTQTYPAGSDGKVYTLMDRNLGAKDDEVLNLLSSALTYWTDGLFYQWGRKDPIRLDANGERANTEAAKNADVQFDPSWNASDSWTASKAVTDPCPPGYKVPSSSVWRDEPSSGAMELIAKNTLTAVYPYNVVSSEPEKAILYPYIGYIKGDGIVSKGIKTDMVTEKTSSVSIYSPTSAAAAVIKTEPWSSNPPKQFKNVQYIQTDINIESSCWSSDNSANSMTYGYVSNTLEIIAYEYRTGTWKETVTKLPWYLGGGTTYTYTPQWSSTWHTVTSEWDEDNNTYNDKLSDYDRSEILQILKLGQLFSSRTLIYDKTSQNVKYANQVRCVAE